MLRTLTMMFLLMCVGMTMWAHAYVRNSPAPVRINSTEVNIERVADEFRIVMIGEKSVYVPSDQGGTGQRMWMELWELQVKTTDGSYRGLVSAWGLTDDVVPFLQAKQRQLEASIDVMMFGQPGYTPKFPFEPF